MLTGVSQLCCGNCGHHGFRMFQAKDGSLLAECMQCKSTSTIQVSRPEIKIGWGENSDGILCHLDEKP